MATLNVKNVPDRLYKRLRLRAQKERRSISQEVIHILSDVVEESPPVSILELRGLGKAAWKGRDGAAHVRRERDSWS